MRESIPDLLGYHHYFMLRRASKLYELLRYHIFKYINLNTTRLGQEATTDGGVELDLSASVSDQGVEIASKDAIGLVDRG